jgi:hypothetical protein
MSIYNDSRLDVLAWFNKKAGTKFTLDDVIFSKPIVNTDPGATLNSKIRVTMARTNTAYKGTVVLAYNRLTLANIGNYPRPKYPPQAPVGSSVYDLLPKLRNTYGIYLTRDDLEETFVTDDGAYGRILLKAKADSIGWNGEYTLVLSSKIPLADLFKTKSINWS